MKRIYVDEIYKNENTILTFVILSDEQKNEISKQIRKIIRTKESNAKTRSKILSEYKSSVLRKTKYWDQILKIVKSGVHTYGSYKMNVVPKNKSEFSKKYADFIINIYKEYNLPIIVDIINNKNFMSNIEKKLPPTLNFSYISSETDKGIQIADILAALWYDTKMKGRICFSFNLKTKEGQKELQTFTENNFKKANT